MTLRCDPDGLGKRLARQKGLTLKRLTLPQKKRCSSEGVDDPDTEEATESDVSSSSSIDDDPDAEATVTASEGDSTDKDRQLVQSAQLTGISTTISTDIHREEQSTAERNQQLLGISAEHRYATYAQKPERAARPQTEPSTPRFPQLTEDMCLLIRKSFRERTRSSRRRCQCIQTERHSP